jgi:hypothetical protein
VELGCEGHVDGQASEKVWMEREKGYALWSRGRRISHIRYGFRMDVDDDERRAIISTSWQRPKAEWHSNSVGAVMDWSR